MHNVSALYKSIVAGDYTTEVKLVVEGFEPGEEVEYGMDVLKSVSTYRSALGDTKPTLGLAVAGEIDVYIFTDFFSAPRMAKMQLFVRVCSDTVINMGNFIAGGLLYLDTDAFVTASDIMVLGQSAFVSNDYLQFKATVEDRSTSEWIPKGVYFIDTREMMDGYVRIHGYDAMLKAEQPFPSADIPWPTTDAIAVAIIATEIGVEIDERTVMGQNFPIQLPEQYVSEGETLGDVFSMRDTLAGIAGLYGGAWIINDYGKLQLLLPWNAPEETYYLLQEGGDYLTVGDFHILLRRGA